MPDPESADSIYDLDLSTHPHDGFFKAVFSDPDKAGAFFRKHLPEDVVQRIEWSSLTVLPGSFVKRDLLDYYWPGLLPLPRPLAFSNRGSELAGCSCSAGSTGYILNSDSIS